MNNSIRLILSLFFINQIIFSAEKIEREETPPQVSHEDTKKVYYDYLPSENPNVVQPEKCNKNLNADAPAPAPASASREDLIKIDLELENKIAAIIKKFGLSPDFKAQIDTIHKRLNSIEDPKIRNEETQKIIKYFEDTYCLCKKSWLPCLRCCF